MESQYNGVAKIIGVVILVGLVWGGYKYFAKRKAVNTRVGETSSSLIDLRREQEKKIEEKTKIVVPETGDKAILSDVSGGEGIGVARRIKEGNRFEIELVANLADLPDGSFYEGWLVRGEEKLLVGRLMLAKAGYLVTNNFDTDISGYSKVVVVQVLKTGVGEKKVLEGSF